MGLKPSTFNAESTSISHVSMRFAGSEIMRYKSWANGILYWFRRLDGGFDFLLLGHALHKDCQASKNLLTWEIQLSNEDIGNKNFELDGFVSLAISHPSQSPWQRPGFSSSIQ